MIKNIFIKQLETLEGITILKSKQNTFQSKEIEFRKKIAVREEQNWVQTVSRSHSIPVMDKEVKLFLDKIPRNGIILDAGGCLGWHWRNIDKIRPDIKIVIIDFVYNNLINAKLLLGNLIDKNIFLCHGDITDLKLIKSEIFDGYWSVQVLQHIPNYIICLEEAKRILKKNGIFANYSRNNQSLIRNISKLLNKDYHECGETSKFYLCKADNKLKKEYALVFESEVTTRFTEIIYQNRFKLKYNGEYSVLGKIDSILSSDWKLFTCIARQRSFHLKK